MTDARSPILQGTLDLMVLKTLEQLGPLHGYGIARRIEQVGQDALVVNQGTIYLCLVRLVQKKWIKAQWGTSDNNRKAKFYSITRAGPDTAAGRSRELGAHLRRDRQGAAARDGKLSVRAAFHTLVARIRGFLRPNALDADFDQEMAAHLAAAEEDAIRRGLTREEAHRRARIELGGLTQLREASRAAQGLPWVGACWLDIKLGIRLLAKYPGLTLVSTLALAIGIAIVGGFHAGTEFIVRPTLPDAHGERIVAIWNHDLARSDRGEQTLGDMLAWRRELTSVHDMGAFVLQQRTVAAADGQTRLVPAAQISASAFEILRTAPLLGRALRRRRRATGRPGCGCCWDTSCGSPWRRAIRRSSAGRFGVGGARTYGRRRHAERVRVPQA